MTALSVVQMVITSLLALMVINQIFAISTIRSQLEQNKARYESELRELRMKLIRHISSEIDDGK